MPYFRGTFAYEQRFTLPTGWTTNFWFEHPDMSTAVAVGHVIAGKLQALCGQSAGVTFFRMALFGGQRISQLVPLNPVLAPPADVATTADYPGTSALLKLVATNGRKSYHWLRGIPDNCVTAAGRWQPVAPIPAAINSLINTLIANGGRVKTELDAGTETTLQDISNTGVVTAPGHPFNNGDWIRVSRARGLCKANGVWKVTNRTSDSFSLQFFPTQPDDVSYLGYGVAWRLLDAQFLAIVAPPASEIVRTSSRRPGRPFGSHGGRRKRTVC